MFNGRFVVPFIVKVSPAVWFPTGSIEINGSPEPATAGGIAATMRMDTARRKQRTCIPVLSSPEQINTVI